MKEIICKTCGNVMNIIAEDLYKCEYCGENFDLQGGYDE